jgi:hypothetical protein
MSMQNRRNALVGWITLIVGKKLLLTKLRKVEPEPKLSKVQKSLIAAIVAVGVGAAVWLRIRPSGDGDDDGGIADVVPPIPPITVPEPAAAD